VSKRQENSEKNDESKDFSTFSTPEMVAEPSNEKDLEDKELNINQRETQDALKTRYLDPMKKWIPRDLAVIRRPDYFPDDKKKDRRYNRCVRRAKNDLDLLSFLLEALKPRYRKQILLSDEFNHVLKKYLGISDETSKELSQQEKDQALIVAIQMLGSSLAVIKKNMPEDFHQSLNDLGLPFANLVDSISSYASSRDKYIPRIRISEQFIPK